MSDTFTLYINDDSSYTFSFLSYIGSDKTNSVFENDTFKCSLVKTHLYSAKTIFEIEITNKIDSPIFIDKEEIYVYTGMMPKYYPSSVLIPENSSTTFYYTIYTGLSLENSLPNKLYFRGLHANGNVYIFNLPIKYPINI